MHTSMWKEVLLDKGQETAETALVSAVSYGEERKHLLTHETKGDMKKMEAETSHTT